MTGNMRSGLRTAAALAALAFGACGGGEDKGDDDNKDAGGSPREDAGNAPSNSMDGGMSLIADLDDNVAGKPCTTEAQCSGTNAACVGVCTGACETDDNCGAGGTCLKALGGALGQYGACAKTCSQKSDCSEGQDCRDGLRAGDLFGEAVGVAQEAGITLDPDSGIDVSNLPKTCGPAFMTVDLPDGVVGKPCTGAAQCAPGECLTGALNYFLTNFPGGYCTGGCLTNDQCGKGGICYKNAASEFLGTEGSCLLGCSGPSDCANGLVCRTSQILLESTPRNYCLPPVPDAGTPAADSGAGGADAGAQDAAVGGG